MNEQPETLLLFPIWGIRPLQWCQVGGLESKTIQIRTLQATVCAFDRTPTSLYKSLNDVRYGYHGRKGL